MSDEMEKELRKLQESREYWERRHAEKPSSFDPITQSTFDKEEVKIRAKYGQLSPSGERAFHDKMEAELREHRQHLVQLAVERGYPPDTYLNNDDIEESEQFIRESYELPTPEYKAPQPSYTPLEWVTIEEKKTIEDDEEDEFEDEDEWDEENEDKETDEEEDYIDRPPAFVFTPASPTASAPRNQGPDRHQPAGGKWRLGRDIQTGGYVDAPQAGRKEGLYIIGATGTGKTGLIENLIIQDIKQGLGVGLLDPHGDLINAVLSRMDRREDDVILLDITDYHYPFGINLFSCSDPTNPLKVSEIVEQVRHVFEKALGVSQETQLILEYLYNCTSTLIANPGYTMADIPLLLQDGQCRKKLVAHVTDSDVQLFWRLHEQKKPADQNTDIASTLRRVRQLLQPLSRPIVGQSASTIDLQKIMDEGKILLVKLSARLDSTTSLIGSVLIALFLNAAYARPANKRRQFNLYADEFQRFATEDFATLLTEARKFGIATTIAHQARYQPGMTDGIRATSLSAKNLVVFKVNSKDGDELAGEFDITPQEAWEEELEPERIKVLRPQRHERKEEQVEIEVEEDIEEISQNPVDFLVSARGTHGSAKVRTITQEYLVSLTADEGRTENMKAQKEKIYVNKLLVAVMEGRLKPGTEAFAEAVVQIMTIHFDRFYHRWWSWERTAPGFIRKLVFGTPQIEAEVEKIGRVASASVKEQIMKECRDELCSTKAYVQERWGQIYDPKYGYRYMTYDETLERFGEIIERECEEEANRSANPPGAERYARDEALQCASLVTLLLDLCEELAKEPIRVPTGQKRMVKRIQPHITYLTHESERLTIPRKTISHPQRSYADVLKQVASELVNQDNYIARVRYIDASQRRVECTIRTLDPKQDADRPLFGQALEDRVARIQAHNRTPDENGLCYCRPRQEVEAEIRTRQGQCSQPPPDEPPIARRPSR